MNEHLRLEFNEWARAGKGESMERGHRPVGRAGERAVCVRIVRREQHVVRILPHECVEAGFDFFADNPNVPKLRPRFRITSSSPRAW